MSLSRTPNPPNRDGFSSTPVLGRGNRHSSDNSRLHNVALTTLTGTSPQRYSTPASARALASVPPLHSLFPIHRSQVPVPLMMAIRYRGEDLVDKFVLGDTDELRRNQPARLQAYFNDLDAFFLRNVTALDAEAAEVYGPPVGPAPDPNTGAAGIAAAAAALDALKLLNRNRVKRVITYSKLDAKIKLELASGSESTVKYEDLVKVLKDRYGKTSVDRIQAQASMNMLAMDSAWNTQQFVDQLKIRGKESDDLPERQIEDMCLMAIMFRHKDSKLGERLRTKHPKTLADAKLIWGPWEDQQLKASEYRAYSSAFGATPSGTPANPIVIDAVHGRNVSPRHPTASSSNLRCSNCNDTRCKGLRRPCNNCGADVCCEKKCRARNVVCDYCKTKGHGWRLCLKRAREDPSFQGGNRAATGSYTGRRSGNGDKPRKSEPPERHVGMVEHGPPPSGYRYPAHPVPYPNFEMSHFFNMAPSNAPEYPENFLPSAHSPANFGYGPNTLSGFSVHMEPLEPYNAYPVHNPWEDYRPPPTLREIKIDEVCHSTEQVSTLEWWEPVSFPSGVQQQKIDCGAMSSIMGQAHLAALGVPLTSLLPSKWTLSPFVGESVRPLGCWQTTIILNGQRIPASYEIVPYARAPLVGMPEIRAAQLIPGLDNRLRQLEIAEMSAYRYEIIDFKVKDNAVPKIFPTRSVPLALREQVRAELLLMEQERVITRVTEPIAWCNPMQVVAKPNGKIRICMDPRYLNQFLERAVHPFPDFDEVLACAAGNRFFFKIDLSNGFWNLRLSVASSYLCVFNTPFGRFQYLQMPFGVSPAPEIFHRVVGDVLRPFGNKVIHYVDDIFGGGATAEECDALEAKVIHALEQACLALNRAKCVSRQTRVNFLGFVITTAGVEPTPEKVQEILNMPPPTNVSDVRTLMGVVQFLSRFIPNLSATSGAIRQLLKQVNSFEWNEPQQRAFAAIKDALRDPRVLRHFDPRGEVVIATDASGQGLGGVLQQRDPNTNELHPVLYVSRSLTDPETRYSTIEKELMGVVFALERLRFYTLGREVTVQTDHQPLVGLAKKDLDSLSIRLRRFMERLFPFVIKWQHIPGKENILPDYLSRYPATPPNPYEAAIASVDKQVDDGYALVLLHGGTLFEILAEHSRIDLGFQFVREYIAHGWPDQRHVHPTARCWFPQRDEIRDAYPFLALMDDRVLIPPTLQPSILAELHRGHPGMTAMAERARCMFYWPRIQAQIFECVQTCGTCQAHRPTPQKQPASPPPQPQCPGDILCTDHFELEGKDYLVFYDLFSQFPFLLSVPDKGAAAFLTCLRTVCEVSGLPRQLCSDGGGAFTSEEARKFYATYGISHRLSTPRYPQSNGAAESAVKFLKRLKATCQTVEDLFRAILYARNTPKPGMLCSPAQIFLGRNLRTPLQPSVRQHTVPWQAVACRRQQAFHRAHTYYNSTAKPLSSVFAPGQQVLIHNWTTPGTKAVARVVGPASQPRGYQLLLPSGRTTTRNSRFLTDFSGAPLVCHPYVPSSVSLSHSQALPSPLRPETPPLPQPIMKPEPIGTGAPAPPGTALTPRRPPSILAPSPPPREPQAHQPALHPTTVRRGTRQVPLTDKARQAPALAKALQSSRPTLPSSPPMILPSPPTTTLPRRHQDSLVKLWCPQRTQFPFERWHVPVPSRTSASAWTLKPNAPLRRPLFCGLPSQSFSSSKPCSVWRHPYWGSHRDLT